MEVDVLPGSNETIEDVNLFDDDSGAPGNFIAGLYYVETAADGKERWDLYENEIAPPYPIDGDTYWVVAHATIPQDVYEERDGTASM